MLTRPELIDDWRRRLQSAEGAEVRTVNLRWLARMQARVYRFLLSCYCTADWRADSSVAARDSEVFGETEVPLTGGKPPKPVEQMRGALAALAKAQEHPAAAGPLQGGLQAGDWIVAFSGSRIQATRVALLLRSQRIPTRRIVQGANHVLEVTAGVRGKARQLIEEHRHELAPSNRAVFVRKRATPRWVKLSAAVFLSLLAGLTLVACWAPAIADKADKPFHWWEFSLTPGFYIGVWAGCWLMFVCLIYVDDLAKFLSNRILRSRRHP